MPNPRPALRAPVSLILAGLMLMSVLVPSVSALYVSSRAVKVVGSQTYRDQNVQAYAGQIEGFTGELDGQGIGIAVLDTGVDDRHPTFKGAFVAGAKVQHPCQPNDKDCVTDMESDGSSPEDCFNPDDTDGHGTHVASIALGRGTHDGPRGIAPGARLIDVKVAADVGGISVDGIRRGIEWVIRYNQGKAPCAPDPPVSVISVSFGSAEPHRSKNYTALMQAVRNATRNGILVVTAAGNCGPGSGSVSLECPGNDGGRNTITSPGATPEALTVGAITDHGSVRRSEDAVAGYSSRGPNPADNADEEHWRKPDVVAPGTRIAAACAQTSPSTRPQQGQGMDCNLTGTSMAVPHVSGLAALLFQAEAAIPDGRADTPQAIKKLITRTATDWGRTGWDRASGYGYVDGYAAVVEAVNRPPEAEFSYAPGDPEPGQSVTFDASNSHDPDSQDTIERYIWRFGDGSAPVETGGQEVAIDHVFEENGSYTVSLVAVDGHGTKDPTPFRRTVQVREEADAEQENAPPNAKLSSEPRRPRAGEEVIFDASGSSDPDGDPIVRYAWDFDGAKRDGFEAERRTTDPRTNWTFAQAGTQQVGVRVFDGKGQADTTWLVLTVHPRPPKPPVVNVTNPQEGDTVQQGVILASWTDRHPVNNFTVFLDSVQEARLVERQLRLEVGEGEHTLRIVARGPGGRAVDWVNFTAVSEERLQATSACPNGTDGSGSCPSANGSGADPSGAGTELPKQPIEEANRSEANQTPLGPTLALIAAMAAAVLTRRRRP